MKIDVSPAKGRMVPSSSAALSSSRSEVVPTATMRPPAARAAFSAAAVSALTVPALGVHAVLVGIVGLHRQEGAGADMQRHHVRLTPSASRRANSVSVKCSPAVGAATAPSSRA